MRQRRRNTPDVAIAKNDNESAAINECLGLLTASNLINQQDIVVITPNWVQEQTPDTGIVVGTESLRTVIRFAKSAKPKRVIVAAGSGEKDTLEIMKNSGYDKIIANEGAEFVDLNHGPFIRVNLNHDKPDFTYINKLLEEMTFLISFTQLKHHEEATMSGAIKNVALGWPPAEQHGHPKKNLGIHESLHGFIAAMAELVPIDLSIVSASPAMIGTGPANGLKRHTGIVVAGTDPVATDTVGARLLGFRPQAVQYLYTCGRKNIGESNIDKINVSGMNIIDAEAAFATAAYGNGMSLDAK